MLTNPSRLAASVIDAAPVGQPHEGDATHCCLCGALIEAGDIAAPFRPAASFIEQNQICSDGQTLCGWCPIVFNNKVEGFGNFGFTLQTQSSLIASDVIYEMNKNTSLAWFFENIPEPPFVLCVKKTKRQHTVWKAAVTLDKALVQVQSGDFKLMIRTKHLFDELIPAAARLGKLLADHLGNDRAPHPFIGLRASDVVGATAMFHPALQEAIENNDAAHRDVDVLRGAKDGELWAMSILCRSEKIKPEQPGIIAKKETS